MHSVQVCGGKQPDRRRGESQRWITKGKVEGGERGRHREDEPASTGRHLVGDFGVIVADLVRVDVRVPDVGSSAH